MKTTAKIKTVLCIVLIFLFNPCRSPLFAQDPGICPYPSSVVKKTCFSLNKKKMTLHELSDSSLERWTEDRLSLSVNVSDIKIGMLEKVRLDDGDNITRTTLALRKYNGTDDVIGYEKIPKQFLNEPLQKVEANLPWYERNDFYVDLEGLVRGIRTKPLF